METDNRSGVSVWIVAGLGLASLMMCAFLTVGAFFLGQWTVRPDETARSIVEVTRVVTVAAPAANAGAAQGAPLAAPGDGASETVDEQAAGPALETVDGQPAPTEEPAGEPQGDPAGEPASAAPGERPSAIQGEMPNVELLLEVWDLLQEQYDGDVPSELELFYAAIDGSLATLDDEFTRFVPPDVARRSREQLEGSYEGIGAFVGMTDDGFFEIVRPIDGQPAQQAGLRARDIVIAVDGVSVLTKSMEEIITLVKGPRGTQVTLTIRREGVDDFDVTITRAAIEIPIIEAEMLDNHIAYIRLTSFSSNAEEQLLEALDELQAQNPRALIFDLRDNPGGFLSQALAVSDQFLDDGVILFERNNRGLDRTYSARAGGQAERIPLVVLVNAGSASASEIVAGAVQDNGRGIVIGETTFGKGSVQQPNTLTDGSELRVTIARWYTPNNKSINGQGIAPDIEIPSPESLGGEDDTQLQRAIEYVLNGR